MDPFAPANVPRRKRGGGTTFERNDGPRDFRATLPQEQQDLFNPIIGTTRFAYMATNGISTIKVGLLLLVCPLTPVLFCCF